MSSPIEIIIADDHPIFREGLRQIFKGHERIRVSHVVEDGRLALERAAEGHPAVLVLDVSMPEMGGLEVARERQRQSLSFEVVLLTMHDDKETFHRALDLGVKGYVLKDDASEDIVRCVEAVAEGRPFLSSGISHLLLESRPAPDSKAELVSRTEPKLGKLTASERKILKMIAEDMSSKEIAGALGISPKTVDNHRSNMCAKLGLFGSHSLMRFALEMRDEL